MCNQASLSVIQDVATEWVNDGRMFTAFEISLEVQKRVRDSGGQPERHRHMKGAIHQELERYINGGTYCQQLQDVGAGTPAFVYYPPNEDPATYKPLARKDSPPQAPADPTLGPVASQPATTPAAPTKPSTPGPGLSLCGPDDSDDGDQVDSAGRRPDQRGTLTVPNQLLRAAGFQPKDIAYVTSRDDNGAKVLVLSKRTTSQPITTYTVDYATNVRVTSHVLSTAGIGGSNATYDFDGTGDEVLVKLHD